MMTDPAWSENLIYLDSDMYGESQDIVPVKIDDIYMVRVIFYQDWNLKPELEFWIFERPDVISCRMTEKCWNRFRKNLASRGFAAVRGERERDILPIRTSYYVRVRYLIGVYVPKPDRPADCGTAWFVHGNKRDRCGIFDRRASLKIQKLLYER